MLIGWSPASDSLNLFSYLLVFLAASYYFVCSGMIGWSVGSLAWFLQGIILSVWSLVSV